MARTRHTAATTGFAPHRVGPRTVLLADTAASGALALGELPLGADAEIVRVVDGDHTLTFTVARRLPVAAAVQRPAVVQLQWTDRAHGDEVEEFRVEEVTTLRRGAGGARALRVVARRPVRDLNDCGFCRTLSADGTPVYSYSFDSQTAAQVFDAFAGPVLRSWMVRGTFDATALLTGSVQDVTPLGLARALQQLIREKGQPCELEYEVTRTQHRVHLRRQTGAGLPTAELRLGTHLSALDTTARNAEQTTRVLPRDPTGATSALALWRVDGVDAATQRVQLADRAGGAGPIGFDEQRAGTTSGAPAAAYLQAATGRLYRIQHTDAATQWVTLAEPPDSFAVGDRVSFRGDAASGPAGPVSNPLPITTLGATGGPRGAGRVVTLGTTFFVLDPVTTDGQFLDAPARVADPVLTRSLTWTAPARLSIATGGASLATLAVGDLLPGDVNLQNTHASLYTVTAVDVAGQYVDVAPLVGTGTPTGPNGSFATFTFYRRRAGRFRVSGALASADTVALTPEVGSGAAVSDLTVGQFVVFDPRDRPGALVDTLDHPAGVAAYGPVFVPLTCPGVVATENLLADPYFDGWSGGTTARPDALRAMLGTVRRVPVSGETAPSGTPIVGQYGAYLAAIAVPGSGVFATAQWGSWFDAHPDAPAVTVTVRVWIDGGTWVDDDGAGGYGPSLQLAVLADNPDAPGGTTVSASPGVTRATRQWVTLSVEGVRPSRGGRLAFTLTAASGLSGGFAVLWPNPTTVYVDAVQISRTPQAADLRRDSGGARLHAAGNLELAETWMPPLEGAVQFRDLYAVDPVAFASARAALGAWVRARTPANDPAAVDLTARVAQATERPCDPMGAQLTLQTRPTRLTERLALNA